MILKEAVTAVQNRQSEYKDAEAYYEGSMGEQFATKQLRHVLRATKHRGQHNYVRVVTDAVLNRLEIANIIADTKRAQDKVSEVMENNELELEANEIHRRALEFGDCYALVWPDESGELLISYNSPKTTRIVYDPENPRRKLYAVKMWLEGHPFDSTAKRTRMNIYTADAIKKYVADTEEATEGTNWNSLGSEDNPFGAIPVFHFRTHRPYGKPEALEGFGAQNDINKLLATHMFTVDYQGAPQRYALAYNGDNDVVDFGDDETERENVGSLQSAPGNLWYLKGIMNVGQFQPADPKVFWEPINSLKQSMAALTDTPFHFLEKSLNVSGGEALRVAEAPLMKKVADRQASFGATWKELFKFILKVEGIPKVRLEVQWEIHESMDETERWDIQLKKLNAGLSHAQVLREMGYAEADITRILEERAAETANTQFYNRTDNSGQQTQQPARTARTSTADNAALNENRNGLTQDAKVNGGRGDNTNG